MIDFDKELKDILENDPLGLLAVKPRTSSAISNDDRLVSSFNEINAFYEVNKREPAESSDISERKLYSRLKGLRENPEKASQLAAFDGYHLLKDAVWPATKEIETVDDVLDDDPLGLLGENSSVEDDLSDIFTIRNFPKNPNISESIARRKPCKNFDQFENLFKQTHEALESGNKQYKPFTSELQITIGAFFILQGMLVYIANIGTKVKKNFGNVNARLHCVFENGTESYMLLRSLAAALWKTEGSSEIVDAELKELFDGTKHVEADDEATGFIYVLRSLSNDPKIEDLEDLYKIGFSTQPSIERVKNATQEPTYLMANVQLISEFQTFNLNPQKLEGLLHTFFAEACLNIDVFDNEGKRHTPREWFIVPLHVIEIAIKLLINGEIIHYRYDHRTQSIIERVD
jgi:hypothetical protein